MNLLPRPSHIPFQTKVLLPVVATLVLLTAVTVTLVNRHVASQSLLKAKEKLSAAEAVFLNSLDIRDRAQQLQFRNAVNDSRFKAIARLNDPETTTAFLQSLIEEFETEVEALLFSPANGAPSSGASRQPLLPVASLERDAASLIDAALEGSLQSELSAYSNHAYNLISVPVFVTDFAYPEGALTIAIRLSGSGIADLKSLTHTELILVSGQSPVGSTLPPEQAAATLADIFQSQALAHPGDVRATTLQHEHFHLLENALPSRPTAPHPLRYILLSSYENELEALAGTRNLLLAIGFLGTAFSVGFLFLHVRRITSPLRLLKQGADAVGRGNLEHTVHCHSNDECGDLAQAFNQMTGNLLASRRDLEKTVAELRQTQDQLVQREARLRESEEGLRLMVEGARDHAIFTIDDHGRVLRWNRASERILGYSSDESRSLDYDALFDPQDNRAEALLDDARRHGQASYEGWRQRKDGSRFWADVTLSRLPTAAGSPNGGFVEIARDITARKEAEIAMARARDAAEASDRAKSEFLANMSHEFRTPMNGIIGMSSLLGELSLTDEQREFVDTIRLSADSLLAIIDDILDISKIEAGELEVESAPFPLFDTLEQSLQLFQSEAESKALELHLNIDPNVPACVATDSSRLRQILSNLVGNAVKFTAKGGVLVSVAYQEPDETLCIEVKDTGIGVPDDKLELLFDPFFQVESSASRQFGGTGLGLTIVRNLLKLLGGSIDVQSELGSGSSFRFRLPAPRQNAETAFAAFPGKRALLVADSPLARTGLETQLSQWQLDVHTLSSQPDPLRQALASQTFHALLIDQSAARPDTIRAILDRRQQMGSDFPPILRLVASSLEEGLVRSERCVPLPQPVGPQRLNRQLETFFAQTPTPASREAVPRSGPDTPAVATPATPPSAADATDNASFADAFPLRILVVEDNPINTKVLVKLLAKLGYRPQTAANGEEGLAAAESMEFDAILMDLQMPVMDGLEATRRIVSSKNIQHPVFISAFTANARDDDRAACDEAGMQDFVAKPARIPAVKAMLERAHAWVASQRAQSAS